METLETLKFCTKPDLRCLLQLNLTIQIFIWNLKLKLS